MDKDGKLSHEETDFKAIYTDDYSHIQVYSKTKSLYGTYQVKIVAIDGVGHSEDSDTHTIRVNSTSGGLDTNFPLSILTLSNSNIPGYGVSTTNLNAIKDSYTTTSTIPTFFGIAYNGATVNLSLTDDKGVTKSYSTFIGGGDSRYSINIPKGDLTYGKTYTAFMSVTQADKYNELPSFNLKVGGSSGYSTNSSANQTPSTKEESTPKPTATPTPAPTPMPSTPVPQGSTQPKKNCFLFLCW